MIVWTCPYCGVHLDAPPNATPPDIGRVVGHHLRVLHPGLFPDDEPLDDED